MLFVMQHRKNESLIREQIFPPLESLQEGGHGKLSLLFVCFFVFLTKK